MKKPIIFIVLLLSITILSSCKKDDVYKIGATPVPHKEILEHIQPLMLEQGFEFKIIEFTDYVFPNIALDSGEIIANFFQHTPYLNAQIKEYGYDFANAGGVHVEPIGLYSKDYSSLESFPETIEFIISNSPTDRARLLGVLEQNGIISLNQSTSSEDITSASVNNLPSLFSSEKTITFIEVDPTLLYTNYINNEGDAVLINGNYALDNGLNPLTDAIIIEDSSSPYVNIIVVKSEDLDDPFIVALMKTLQSEEVQNWIRAHYEGSVVPIM